MRKATLLAAVGALIRSAREDNSARHDAAATELRALHEKTDRLSEEIAALADVTRAVLAARAPKEKP